MFFQSKRTNAEMMSFRERHPRITKCAKHIFDEDGSTRRISGPGRWLPAGVAAGLLYLMSSAKSDGDAYRNPRPNKAGLVQRSEKDLDFSLWEKACEFWVMLASVDEHGHCPDPNFNDFVRNMRRVRRPEQIATVDGTNQGTSEDPKQPVIYIYSAGTTLEKTAAICKAWKVFLSGEKPTPGLFKLAYSFDAKTGLPSLAEDPDCGGIDLGNTPHFPAVGANGETPASVDDPTPEQIAEQAEAIKQKGVEESGLTDTGNLH